MNGKVKTIGMLFIVTFLFFSVEQVAAQEKVIISAGIGYPELINVGIKYQAFNQAKIGLSIGWFPQASWGYIGSNRTLSVSGDFYYHFGNSSKFSSLRTCYVRIGLNDNWDLQKPSDVYYPDRLNAYGRIGKDLYINNNAGISIDGGLRLSFHNVTENFLALGICYFYRF